MKRSKHTGGLSAGRTTLTLTIAAAMLLSGMAILSPTDLNAEAATQEPGADWEQDRFQFAYRPDNHDPTEVDVGIQDPYPDQLGVYFNWVESLNDGELLSVRLYGENGGGAPDLWEDREDAFRPEAIPTDSATFNPAMIIHTDSDFTKDNAGNDLSWMRGCDEEDSNLKKHLRAWYEPGHAFNGPRADAGFFNPPTVADVLQVETTYYLVSANDYQPYPICAGDARFPFPTEGSGGALALLGAGAFDEDTSAWPQPGLDTMREVRTTLVETGPTDSEGTVRMERQGQILSKDMAIQMFDHVYRYEGIEEDFSGNMRAKFTVWYAGNTNLDSRTTVLLGGAAGTQKFLSRANNLFNDVAHPVDNPTQPRTSFINVKSFTDDTVTFDVGKQIRGGDIFYVDGVRYEFPSVFVTEDAGRGQDVLHQLTVRTPFPKSDPSHNDCDEAWSSVPDQQLDDLNREACLQGQWQVQDWSVVSTQRIIQINHEEPLPVNPPFNHEFYRQVDDTDVVLWEPGPAQDREDECATEAKFPWGERNDGVPDGDGMPFFRLGHTYVTQSNPPQGWLDCWAAEPTGFDDLAERVDESAGAIDQPGLNHDAWILGAELPVLPDTENTNFYWHKEWCDDRFSTNLQQILKENGLPSYTSYEIDSQPCAFTEFVLPDRDNQHSSIGFLADSGILGGGVELDSGKDDLTLPGGEKRLNFGDYLVMSSFHLQDGATRLAFTHKPDAASLEQDLDASNDAGNRGDLYVQTVDTVLNETELFETTLRLYGASGEGPIDYTEYWHAFDPYAIGKDSVTFNPAIILHEDDDFTGHDQTFGWLKSCDESNSNLKKTMRMWYEPGQVYDGPRVESGATTNPTVADVITLESSYKLVDADSYVPRTMCEGGRVPFPVEGYRAFQHPNGTYVVEGDPQPGLNAMRSLRIGDVSGSGTDGVVELYRQNVNLGIDESVQIFDHLFVYQGVEEDFANPGQMKAKFRIYYLGNPAADSAEDQLIDGDQRYYVSRANHLHDAPSHGWGGNLPVRTTFIDLTQGTFNDTHVTFNVGKELAKDDTFYVTGVRYDIPAVYVTEDPLAGDQLGVQYLTMRTALPKSDPNRGNGTGADYTTVPNEQMEGSPSRETYDNPGAEWVVRDESVVSTQRIREFTFLDPLPLNPPFNGVTGESDDAYRMVDDTDILLWEAGADPESDCQFGFPWGPRNDGVPNGNGLPLFPLGHVYLTMQEPPQEWIDCFDAEPTGFDELAKRVRENEAPAEPGINHNAWEFSDGVGQGMFPVQVVRENTNLFWVSEWCEGRFSTNLLQLVDNTGAYGALQVDSEPCEYTEFVLPDRTNPLSELAANLDTLKDDGVPAGFYKLLGGDYLVTSSFRLHNSGGPENWVNWYDGSGDQTADGHAAGEPDCVIQMADLMVAVNDWFADVIDLFNPDPTVPQLSRVVSDWQQSSAGSPHQHYPGCSHD